MKGDVLVCGRCGRRFESTGWNVTPAKLRARLRDHLMNVHEFPEEEAREIAWAGKDKGSVV